MKKLLSVLFALVLAFGFLLGPGNVSSAADKEHFTPQELKEIKAKLLEIGVYKKDIPHLINKLKKGEVWDSMNPSVVDKVPKEELTPTLDDPVKVYRFKDGSVIRNEVQKPDDSGMITPMSARCGTGYCNFYGYTVSGSTGVISAFFKADFCINYGKYAADHISKVYDKRIIVIGAGYTNSSLKIVRAYEDTYEGRDAYARLYFEVTGVQGWFTSGSYLRFYVGKDKYHASHAF